MYDLSICLSVCETIINFHIYLRPFPCGLKQNDAVCVILICKGIKTEHPGNSSMTTPSSKC